jgi:cytochrome c553
VIYRGGIASKGVAACMACHGPTGKGIPAANYPALAGQHAAYVVSQMKVFAASERKNEVAMKIMKPIAERMTDEETRAVASYIQGLH